MYIYAGADPGFSERGSENLKEGVCTAVPEAIGICIVIHQNHTYTWSICLSNVLTILV